MLMSPLVIAGTARPAEVPVKKSFLNLQDKHMLKQKPHVNDMPKLKTVIGSADTMPGCNHAYRQF